MKPLINNLQEITQTLYRHTAVSENTVDTLHIHQYVVTDWAPNISSAIVHRLKNLCPFAILI